MLLKDSDLKQIHDTMLGDNFPWFFYPDTAMQGDGHFMFTHMFFLKNKINSDFYFLLEPILNFIRFSLTCIVNSPSASANNAQS